MFKSMMNNGYAVDIRLVSTGFLVPPKKKRKSFSKELHPRQLLLQVYGRSEGGSNVSIMFLE